MSRLHAIRNKPLGFTLKVEKMRPEGGARWVAPNSKITGEPIADIGKKPPMPKARKPRN